MQNFLRAFISKFRKLVRLLLAIVIWAHAVFLFQVPDAALRHWLPRMNTSFGEFILLALIIGLSILASYGWGKVTVDLIYIYFFPFIMLFHVGRLAVRLILKLGKFMNGAEADESAEVPYYAQLSLPILTPVAKATVPDVSQVATEAGERKPFARKLTNLFWRPFRRYTLLWCVLLLLTTHRIFIYLALGIVLLRLVDLVIGVLALSFTANGWFTKISAQINRLIDDHMSKISSAKDSAVTQEVKNAWLGLRGILIGVAYLRDRRKVAQWTVFLGCVAFVIIYLYLALLFSFTYYGIARLQNIAWSWSDALLTSCFIPIAYPDLPYTKLLRLAGGVQWLCVIALGASTVIGFFKQQLEAFHSIAENIGRRFERDEVKATIIVVNEKLAAESASK
jgi:hypothetical protein